MSGRDGGRLARAFPVVISGPSGVGKSSIAGRVLASDPALRASVSVTTRRQRPNEVAGRDYTFISDDEFERRRAAGALVEWAEVHGHLYGTPREPLERHLVEGYDVLLDVDYQGGLKIKQVYPAAVLIFLLPPSWGTLEARLKGRRSDDEVEVGRRLEGAVVELAHAGHYDYLMINDHVQGTAARVAAVLASERRRAHRFAGGIDSVRPAAAAPPPPRAASRPQGAD